MNREQRRQVGKKGTPKPDFDPELFISESNAIEGIFDEAEVKQSLIAWEHLIGQSELTHGDICKVQKIITLNQNLLPNQRGYYRGMAGNDVNVTVGGRAAPNYSLVEGLIGNWLLDLPKMTPLIGHIRFEAIHPFVDGNGRTGRMLYWFVCIKKGVKPFLYTGEKRDTYYRLFDQERLIQLSNNNWGIDHQVKFGYEATVKLTDGRMIRAGFFEEPTEADIRESMPDGMELKQVVSIKKVD